MRKIFVHVGYFEREITPLITALEYKELKKGSKSEKSTYSDQMNPVIEIFG